MAIRLDTFEGAKLARAAYEADYRATGAAMAAFPCRPDGKTLDAMRVRPEWQQARKRHAEAFQALRRFNKVFVKRWANELRAERRAKR